MFADTRAVLFDLGGTLIEYPLPGWPRLIGQCLDAVYAHLVRPEEALPPPAADVPHPDQAAARRSPAPPDTALPHRLTVALRRMVRGASGRTLPRMAEACARPLVAAGRLYGDTVPVLEALRDRGYRLGLISNTPWGTPDYLWEKQLRRFGLTDYFAARLFSSGIGYRKPDPRIFQAGLRALEAGADEAVYVGDSPVFDVAGARTAGLKAILIQRDPPFPDPSPDGPDLAIRSLSQLLDHLPPR